ncbi:peptidylprolyl isomerase [Pseudorhodobacter sp. MZDSW-24AT]|uniref:peptidylprolyl isomerase n=1 Tax=Pseudorhodobacter sp. MZDSW-24AT TaxID=2052957 RepID=UPI000C1EF3CC|nr:peptidylprolyl isomerase [Pseudorhodobacter sp. MZDSW-24AT]PJF10026.1 peptidylprolyl isomerase [Pseudorhodobacter sp. MZDSW-24AT]
MTKWTKFLASCAVVGAMSAPAWAQDTSADTVVATVNGTEITLGHMIALRESLPQQYQALPDDVLFNGILDQLIQQTALEQSVTEIAKKDQLALENDRRGYISGVALQAVIAEAVTDEALQAAYDAKFANAEPATEYNAAHILVESEEKATELKAQLDGGADFAELARANSTDVGSGANGGDLGWFGTGMMVKPFEDAVVAAETGKVVGPVQSDFGFHLILVKETRVAAAPTLDETRDELAAEIERAAVDAHIKALTDAADVSRPGEGLDPTLLRDATLLDK